MGEWKSRERLQLPDSALCSLEMHGMRVFQGAFFHSARTSVPYIECAQVPDSPIFSIIIAHKLAGL